MTQGGWFLALFLILLGSPLVGKETLRIARMDSPDHQLIMRVVSAAYEKLQIPVEFVELPGKRSLYEANAGYVDGELSRIKEVEGEFPSLRRVPTPVYWFDAAVFSRTKDLKINGWESLRGLRIGIMRGMLYAELALKNFPRVTVVDKPIHLFRMLNSNRIDVAIFSDLNGMFIIKDQKFTSIHKLYPPLQRIEAYHYLHKRHEDLVPKLDAVFQEMRNSGAMDRMRQEFIRDFTD